MKTIFFILFSLIVLSSFSQDEAIIYNSKGYTNGFSVAGIQQSEASIDLFIKERCIMNANAEKKYQNAGLLKDKSPELKPFEKLSICTVTLDGKIIQKQGYAYVNKDEKLNPENASDKLYSKNEIAEKYPEVFNPELKEFDFYLKNKGYEAIKKDAYTFDDDFLGYFKSKTEQITHEHPERIDKMANRYYALVDKNSGDATYAFFGEKSKEDKFQYAKKFEVITYSKNDEIKGRANIEFTYPRSFKKSQIVYSADNPEEAVGKMFIFSRLNAPKKVADPVKQNVEIVYLDKNGTLKFSKTLKLRADNKGWNRFLTPIADGDKIILPYYYYGSDGSNFGYIKFDQSGNDELIKFSDADIEEKTNVVKDKKGDLNFSRAALGSLNATPGFNWRAGREFIMAGAQKVGGKLFVWGQNCYSVGDPNFKGEGLAPKVKRYSEGIIFTYNLSDNSFEKVNVLNLPVSTMPTVFEVISTKDGGIEFYVPAENKDKYSFKSLYVAKNAALEPSINNTAGKLFSPIFLNINGPNVQCVHIKDLYLLEYNKGLVFNGEGEKMVLGFNMVEAEGQDSKGKTFKYIKYLLNPTKVVY